MQRLFVSATKTGTYGAGRNSTGRFALYETRSTATSHIMGYTNKSFPFEETNEYLTFTYYDNYTFPNKKAFATGGIVSNPSTAVKGLVTGTRTKVLGKNKWLNATTYYDSKYRNIQTVGDLYSVESATAKAIVSTLYDFAGKVIQSEEKQVVGGTTNTLHKYLSYDHAGRLRKLEQEINNSGSRVVLAENKYNELGELVQKKLGGGLQTIDYQYNIKGWLTAINKPGALGTDLFAMALKYETGNTTLSEKAQYNGNVSAMTWEGKKFTGLKTYGYSYDAANRLIKAEYGEGSDYTGNKGHYNVAIPAYDANGNIVNLNRYNGVSLIDELTYTYTANQLQKVADKNHEFELTNVIARNNELGFKSGVDLTKEYTYDVNGNMTDDENKDQSVAYNHLNLTKKVTM